MLTSWSEQSTPAELSIASVLMRPPASAYSTLALLREAEVATLADDPGAHVAAVDPDGVVRLVPDVEVRSPSMPSRTCRCRRSRAGRPARQDRADQLVRRSAARSRSRARRAPPARARSTWPCAGRRRRPRRSPPGRSPPSCERGQREEALALDEARLGVGVGVEEDVRVVEGGDELQVAGEQHAVPEDVAGHVADPDHGHVRASGRRRPARGSGASRDSQAPRAVMPISLWS